MSKTLTEIEKKTRRAVLSYAFWRWENAVIIGGTILLVFFSVEPFAGWPAWAWPAIGGVTLLIMVISTVTDATIRARMRQTFLQEHYNLHAIQTPVLRNEVEKALSSQLRLHAYVQNVSDPTLRPALDEAMAQIVQWVRASYELARRLNAYHHDPLWEQERVTLPQELETLRARRKYENNPEVKQQLDNVIDSKQKQWEIFKALHDRIKQAELQLGRSSANLAVLEKQLQAMKPNDVHQGTMRRLQASLKEQFSGLNSLITSIDEIYAYRGGEHNSF